MTRASGAHGSRGRPARSEACATNRKTPIPETVTLHVPLRIVKRGGRKEMQLPEGASQTRRTDSALVKALARAFRWKRMLESGEFATNGRRIGRA